MVGRPPSPSRARGSACDAADALPAIAGHRSLATATTDPPLGPDGLLHEDPVTVVRSSGRGAANRARASLAPRSSSAASLAAHALPAAAASAASARLP